MDATRCRTAISCAYCAGPAGGLGALVLLGFLCSIALSGRSAGLSDVQRGMYVTSVVLTALAAALLLAPAAYVRLVPGHRAAEQVTSAVHGMGAGGLAAAGLAVSAAVRLAARWVESGLAADLLGAGMAALFAAAWFVLPRLLNRGRPADGRPEGGWPMSAEGASPSLKSAVCPVVVPVREREYLPC